MGVVYEGFDPVIERVVAIKTIRPDQLDESQAAELLARFKREAQAAGRLNHPNIVAIYDYSEVVPEWSDPAPEGAGAQVAFIAMEFVKGRELRDYFDSNQRFPLVETERIMCSLLDALNHAHANGVVHRDMKPANVILLADGKVKVADFGIARIENSDLTQAGTVLGTPSYMSPEQFLGNPVDGRSDIFSCGVILYQFLTGEKPFMGTVTTIMHKVLKEEPLPPSTLNVTLAPAWDAVVKKSMAKNPADRYQTAGEFAAAIKSAVSGASADQTFVALDANPAAAEATVVDRTIPAAAAAATAAAPSAMPAPAPQPAAQGDARSRSNAKILFGAAAALVVAVVGAYFVLDKGRSGGAPAPGASAPAPAQPAGAPAAPVAATPAAAEAAVEPGTMIISALGLADPKDPRFAGDAAAAQAEARADARRQLVEKALSLYVEKASLDRNYAVIEQKLLPRSGSFIKTVIQEGAPEAGKGGLIQAETRAVVKVRDVQKSLNQMSKEERIDFIRNNGDPKIAILMNIRGETQALPPERSQLAENMVKERIKSFGFRVWAAEGETKVAPDARAADFQILGEVKMKELTARLAASGITVTKYALTSWTVKAVDKATGEEIYLNTVTPQGKSWSSQEQALSEIGKLIGDEFSKNFFLQHFNFTAQRIGLKVTGLPDAETARLILRELRGIRQVLDAQPTSEAGMFQLQLPEGSATDIIQDAVLKPLNTKLGQNCVALGGASGTVVTVTWAQSCSDQAVRARLETAPPAGLYGSPDARSKTLLKSAGTMM